MSTFSNRPMPPVWTDGFVVGHSENRITVYFLASQPTLENEPEGTDGDGHPETEPVFHTSVTMAHKTARQLVSTLLEAVGSQTDENAGVRDE